MNGGTCFIASPSSSTAGSGGSTPTLQLMAAVATQQQSPYFNIDMTKMSISASSIAAQQQQRSTTEETKTNNAIHIRSDSDDPKGELDALFDLSRANRMKPMRQRKLPPSFFSYSPKPSTADAAKNPSNTSSSSILTPQSPLAAATSVIPSQQKPAVVADVVPNLKQQLQPPQQNSSPQTERFRNKHIRTRSSPATLEETLAVVPPPVEVPSSTLLHHVSPNSVPGSSTVAGAASPSSNGPLSPLSMSSSSSRTNHRHQPLLLPSRHNNTLLHGNRPLTLAPQPNNTEEAMCIDAVVEQPPASQSPPNKRVASNTRQPVNHSSFHERQHSLPTSALNADFLLKQQQQQQQQPVPASPLLLMSPQQLEQQRFATTMVNGNQHFHSPSLPNMLPISTTTASNFVDNQPLPAGWEMGFTENGQKYFINHLEKTTSWDDPRLLAMQTPARKSPPRSNSSVVLAVNTSKNATNDIRHVRQMSSPILNSSITAFSLANEHEQPLPAGWEKRISEQGQVYFVDHINKQTSWDDPRHTHKADELLPSFQQFTASSHSSTSSANTTTPTPVEALPVQLSNHLRPTNLDLSSAPTADSVTTSGRPPKNSKPVDSSAVQQQQARLRGVLQAEREQMHIRRREHDQKWRAVNAANNPSATQQQNLRPATHQLINSGMIGMNASMVVNNDPFLGNNALLSNTIQNPQQASANGGDFHSRQASCDSGLSSAGGCSLPQTPEGLLAQTLDELNLNQQQQQLHFLQYNKLRSARDNNFHHHHHYQSSLLGNCWPPAPPQPTHFFHPQQNPTIHQKSASIDVGCLTTATTSVASQPRQMSGGGAQSALLVSAEDTAMLSTAAELPEDLSNLDFNDLDSILNPPSSLLSRNDFAPPQQQQGQANFTGNPSSLTSSASSQQQQQHRHRRQQAFCE